MSSNVRANPPINLVTNPNAIRDDLMKRKISEEDPEKFVNVVKRMRSEAFDALKGIDPRLYLTFLNMLVDL